MRSNLLTSLALAASILPIASQAQQGAPQQSTIEDTATLCAGGLCRYGAARFPEGRRA